MGWVAVRTDRWLLVGNSSPELIPFRREATVKAHGVVVAMPLGQGWTPNPPIGRVVDGGTVRCRPRLVQPVRERAGALSAVGAGRGGGLVVVAGVTTRHGGRESRPQGEVAPSNSRWITLTEGRGSEGGGLWVTRLTWTGNREGTTAWRERMERCEGVDGAAVQDPCDMAKTGLFEAQFPGMEMCILRHTTPGAEPPASGESPLLRPNLPAGGR